MHLHDGVASCLWRVGARHDVLPSRGGQLVDDDRLDGLQYKYVMVKAQHRSGRATPQHCRFSSHCRPQPAMRNFSPPLPTLARTTIQTHPSHASTPFTCPGHWVDVFKEAYRQQGKGRIRLSSMKQHKAGCSLRHDHAGTAANILHSTAAPAAVAHWTGVAPGTGQPRRLTVQPDDVRRDGGLYNRETIGDDPACQDVHSHKQPL